MGLKSDKCSSLWIWAWSIGKWDESAWYLCTRKTEIDRVLVGDRVGPGLSDAVGRVCAVMMRSKSSLLRSLIAGTNTYIHIYTSICIR